MTKKIFTTEHLPTWEDFYKRIRIRYSDSPKLIDNLFAYKSLLKDNNFLANTLERLYLHSINQLIQQGELTRCFQKTTMHRIHTYLNKYLKHVLLLKKYTYASKFSKANQQRMNYYRTLCYSDLNQVGCRLDFTKYQNKGL